MAARNIFLHPDSVQNEIVYTQRGPGQEMAELAAYLSTQIGCNYE